MFEPTAELAQGLNEQIGHEMSASMQYWSIATYFSSQTLPELAKFFFKQSDEERDHALKFIQFLDEIDSPVRIPAVPAPAGDFDSPEAAVATALESEKTVTRQIDRLVDLAQRDSHRVAQQFLEWFVTEQLEEVNTMQTLLAVVQRAGDSGLLLVEDFVARGGLAHGDD